LCASQSSLQILASFEFGHIPILHKIGLCFSFTGLNRKVVKYNMWFGSILLLTDSKYKPLGYMGSTKAHLWSSKGYPYIGTEEVS
jgi:hypothetical protein